MGVRSLHTLCFRRLCTEEGCQPSRQPSDASTHTTLDSFINNEYPKVTHCLRTILQYCTSVTVHVARGRASVRSSVQRICQSHVKNKTSTQCRATSAVCRQLNVASFDSRLCQSPWNRRRVLCARVCVVLIHCSLSDSHKHCRQSSSYVISLLVFARYWVD